jgi:hypothetical protein
LRRPGPALAAVLVAAAMLGGCGSGGGSSGASAPANTTTTTTAPAGSASGRTVALDDSANGTTVTVGRGDRLAVTLHNTYWQLAPPADARVLEVTTPPAARPDPTCRSIPGTGCGTVTAAYRALASGTTTLAAHRDTCGEALRCTAAQSDWRVTVHVAS